MSHSTSLSTLLLFPLLINVASAQSRDESSEIGELAPTLVEAREPDRFAAVDATTSTKLDVPLAETPQTISVISEEMLEQRNPSSMGEALRYTPGVQGEPFGFEPRLTFLRMRGFDATTTGLYMDSLQLRNPSFAVGYSLEPYGAERIEIPRGPSSVLYGAGNPGGVVNYITKRPRFESFGEVGVRIGNFNRYETRFDFGGPLSSSFSNSSGAESDFAYRITGLWRDSDTQVDFIEDDRIYLAPSFTWSPRDGTSLTFLAHFQHDDTMPSQRYPAAGTLFPNPNGMIPTDRFTGEPGLDQYERTQFALGYQFEHEFDESLTLRQNLRFHRTDVDDRTVYPTSLLADQRTVTRSLFESFGSVSGLAIDTQLQLDIATGPVQHKLLAGIDYLWTEFDSLQTFGAAPNLDIFQPIYGTAVAAAPVFNNSEGDQSQLGIYLLEHAELDNGLIFSLGGRYDWAEVESTSLLTGTTTSQDDSRFSGRAGILYRSPIGLIPYISYSESFQQSIGTNAAGQPFEPETGKQYEVGLKYQPDDSPYSLTLSAFDATRENYVQTNPVTFLPVQTGEIESRGIEFEGMYESDWGLSLHAALTLLDAEVTQSTNPVEIGSTPTQVPEQTASIWADYTHHSGWGGSVGVRYLGSSWGNAANTLKTPGNTLVDAGIHYEAERFRWDLGVRNIFDEEFVASTFAAGQSFATYGPRRTISTGITYKW